MRLRFVLPLVAVPLALAGCGSKADRQADSLDNAANQADPAAAAVMRNEADTIRESGTVDNGAVQSAMQNAGDAAANNAATPQASSQTQAKPHEAGDTVPPPQQK